MNRTLLLVAASVGVAFVTAACGGTGGYGSYGTTNPGGGTPAASGMATVEVANSSRGHILVDSSGGTLYLFEADRAAASSCYDGCIGVWPAVVTTGQPVAGPGRPDPPPRTTHRRKSTPHGGHKTAPPHHFRGGSNSAPSTP